MTSNENPRRNQDRDRPEDNPFIAFRRFADSSASNIFDTILSLPATFARFNDAHIAREQCLFGSADQEKCEKLRQLQAQLNDKYDESLKNSTKGNLQQALDDVEQLMHLGMQVNDLNTDIVETARREDNINEVSRRETELVQRVATQKGQQWGWSWSWGFPKPFDADDDIPSEDKAMFKRGCRRWVQRKQEAMEEQRKESDKNRDEMLEMVKQMEADMSRHPIGHLVQEVQGILNKPNSYMPEKLEEDEDLKRAGVSWRDAFEDLYRAQRGQPLIPSHELGQSDSVPYWVWQARLFTTKKWNPELWADYHQAQPSWSKRVPWEGEETTEDPSYEYSHDHEDQHDDPPTPKPNQGKWANDMPETELEAYERVLGPYPAARPQTKEESRPSVLSTLTTTERTVAPDGTVTTKVVLKKRFADGREESSETLQTQRGQEIGGQQQQQEAWKAVQDTSAPGQADSQPKGNPKKTGWFWSS